MVLFILGLLALAAVLNAIWPLRGRYRTFASFAASVLTIELAPWLLFWALVATALSVTAGALTSWYGYVGLTAMTLAAVGLLVVAVRAHGTARIVRAALPPAEAATEIAFPRSHVAFPVLMMRRRGVERVRDIVFAEVDGRRLRLDIHRPAEPAGTALRPGILQIHGGAWVMGDKNQQGIPLLNHLAACGWVGINANYRLSPKVAWPTHLIDVKRAIAWYREHAEEFGADPDFLCVTGNSAGGHLAAMVALTANDPEYQPGFEDVDTTVRAAVPFYGVYDVANRTGTRHGRDIRTFVGRHVLQRRYANDPDAFDRASPMARVHDGAPPFFVIHGDLDVLTSHEDARTFVEKLRAVSPNPVYYAELTGAQHGFELFPSHRAARTIEGVAAFLTAQRSALGGAHHGGIPGN